MTDKLAQGETPRKYKVRVWILLALMIPFLFGMFVSFQASDAWAEKTDLFTGPSLVFACYLMVFAATVFLWEDDGETRSKLQSGAKGLHGRFSKNGLGGFLCFAVGPLFLSFLIAAWPAKIIPMIVVAADASQVSHEFVISGRSDTKGRRFHLEGHPFFGGDLNNVPRSIWRAAEDGDKVIVAGQGNRWGVFYSDMRLIKVD